MPSQTRDVVLIGAGIMSATLGALLRRLEPSLDIELFERLDHAAAESSDAWNNAGTGHSGFCELNYTPQAEDGSVDVGKAVRIAEQFELSKQLWCALAEEGRLPPLAAFVRAVPHLSFVKGEADVGFLEHRHRKLTASPLFDGMELSRDPGRIAEWIPLVMDGRGEGPIAATHMRHGTDVNFGALTRALLGPLEVRLGHEVVDLHRDASDASWVVDVRDLASGAQRSVKARFVFIGAGGYSLSLLERSGIAEAKGWGSFPVSGQWLRCINRDVVARHHAKVYGKAEVGAPPMSVPHLDTRWIDGEQHLLFGPYAGITTRFARQGSWLDLLRSIGIDNVLPVVRAGVSNLDLTRYLVGQALLAPEDRLELLRELCPSARLEDWELQIAGLRVQIIQSDGHGGGILKFGTEMITSADGTLAALLGASPGASTAVAIMLELLQRSFAARWPAWRGRCGTLFPSLGRALHREGELCRALRERWAAATK